MVKKPDLSIIIVNFNTKQLLKQCLDSLLLSLRADELNGWEIIVIDNGSRDGSLEMIKKLFVNKSKGSRIKLIENKKNLGFARANNQGIKIAKGRYVLLLNTDVIVRKGTIMKLILYMEKHPEAGIATSKLTLRSGKIDFDCHRGFPTPWAAFCYFTGLEKLFPKSKLFGQYHQTWKNLDSVHEIDSGCGAFLLVRKSVLDEIGGFDESYFFYGEDLDFCYRAKQKGWEIIYYPQTKAIHYKGASSGLRGETKDINKIDRQTALRVARASAEAMQIFYDKFYKNKYPAFMTFLVKSGINFKKAVRLLKATCLNNRTKKIIGLDVRMMGLKHAGIGRYVENLVKELRKEKSLEFILFKNTVRHYSLKEQIIMPWVIWRSKADLVHFPHFNVPIFCPKPFVVTIHDLIKHKFHGLSTTVRFPLIYWLKYIGYLLVFRMAVKGAKKIIVPSRTVKKSLIRKYGLDANKIVVIYEGVEYKFKVQSSKFKMRIKKSKLLKKYNIHSPFVIYTGSLYPHKNIERLIGVIKNLNETDHLSVSLAIVCSRSIFWERMEEKIKKMGAEKFVKLLGFVSDKELVKLYREAVAFIQPSLMEGFDLTVVEAMASGLPAVISDIPVHREIAQDAALYFNPHDIEDIKGKIKLIIENQRLREEKRKKGLEIVKKYNWEKTAKQTLKVYRSILPDRK